MAKKLHTQQKQTLSIQTESQYNICRGQVQVKVALYFKIQVQQLLSTC